MSQLLLRKTRINYFARILIAAYCFSPTVLLASLPSRCGDTYTSAIRFMRIFYPELSAKGINVKIEGEYPFDANGPLLAFYIRISETDQIGRIVAAPYPNPSSADRVGNLSAHFQFDGRDGCIFSALFSGSLVNTERQTQFTKLIDEHPEWSEEQIADRLSAGGAKFGPKQKEILLTKFPTRELEEILGRVEMGPAEFTFRDKTGSSTHAVVTWSIRFWAVADGKRDEYTLAIEPFGGKVVSLGRRNLQ